MAALFQGSKGISLLEILFRDKLGILKEVNKMKKKIGLLYGGKSAEHEVSLSTAKAVTQALNFEEYEIHPIFITLDGEWLIGPQLTCLLYTSPSPRD